MRRASELDREQLIDIVTSIQGFLYLERDERGVDYWEPDKQWSGADVCGHVAGLLDEHGLVPKRRRSYDGTRYALYDIDAEKLVGETVYGSYPDAAEAAAGLDDVLTVKLDVPSTRE